MNTKFVYLLAVLSLAMSSFAVAKAPRARKLKYQTTSPIFVQESQRAEACRSAKDQSEFIGVGSDACAGNGESGLPTQREVDSQCKCEPAIARSPEEGELQCTVGVHWYCDFERR